MIKKYFKITLGLASILSIGVLSASCSQLFKGGVSDDGTKVTTPIGSVDGSILKNPNVTDDKDGQDNQQQGDYIVYNSKSSDDFLKQNNKYLFRALKIDPTKEYKFDTKPEVYNNEGWKNYIPKVFVPIEEISSGSAKLPDYLQKIDQDSSKVTINPESPVGIWEMLRNFTKKDNGIVKRESDSSLSETYKRFLNEMKDYFKLDESKLEGVSGIKRDPSLWLLENENKKSEIKNQDDLAKHFYLYWNKTWADSSRDFIKVIIDNNPALNIDEDTKKVKADLMNLTTKIDSSWDLSATGIKDGNEVKRFFLPFTRGQNSIWQQRFPNSAVDFTSIESTGLDQGVRRYNTWNLIIGIPWTVIRFQKNENDNRDMFSSLINFYLKLSDVNSLKNDSDFEKPTTSQWSKLADGDATKSLDEFKRATNDLVTYLVGVLDWKNLLGEEFEAFEKQNQTIAQLFPALDRSDLEYNWVFAYRFLYDTLIPIYSANGWKLPGSFLTFNFEMNTTELQSHYVYEYALKYLNVIFKHKFKDFKELTIQNITDESLKKPETIEANKKIFFEFLKTWKAKLDINISDTEY